MPGKATLPVIKIFISLMESRLTATFIPINATLYLLFIRFITCSKFKPATVIDPTSSSNMVPSLLTSAI